MLKKSMIYIADIRLDIVVFGLDKAVDGNLLSFDPDSLLRLKTLLKKTKKENIENGETFEIPIQVNIVRFNFKITKKSNIKHTRWTFCKRF